MCIMNKFVKLSKESESLLEEILQHENDVEYWQKRFSNLSDRDDTIIRGSFKELEDNSIIFTKFGDNIPYIIQVLKDGYLYREHKEQYLNQRKEDFKNIKNNKYDVFISHANRDKEDLVEELYYSLEKLGINIFYDKKTFKWGDNWKDKILNGTDNSEFAIIIISKNFFGREWTEKELFEFLNKQNQNGQKLILPILHNITFKQLKTKYPLLTNIQAIETKNYKCDEIALMFAKQLIKRLKTKLFY